MKFLSSTMIGVITACWIMPVAAQTFRVQANITNRNPVQNLTIVISGSAKTQHGRATIKGVSGGKTWDLTANLTCIGVGNGFPGTTATAYGDVEIDDQECQFAVQLMRFPPFPAGPPLASGIAQGTLAWSIVPYNPGDAPGHPTGFVVWSSDMAMAEATLPPPNTPHGVAGKLPDSAPTGFGFGGFGAGGFPFIPIPVAGIHINLSKMFQKTKG